MKKQGNIIDIINKEIYFGEIWVEDGKIKNIARLAGHSNEYILPGFVDAHVHIESSMLVPTEFARLAVVHGTVATVSDPHEIGNVMGVEGVQFMIENGKKVPFKFNFGAPSCVPATSFETAGATIDVDAVRELLENPDIKYLTEMMNYPGVLYGDKDVLAKIEIAKSLGMPIDGHAPGLRGQDAKRYADAGISTDHECFTYEEAKEKISYGMKILIREGSAAKNFDALIPLLAEYPGRIMFCSDDKHPDDLLEGHINQLVARALREGHDLFNVLRAACVNPVQHYKLDVGLLRKGDPADFIITSDLENFSINSTYINGELVASKGQSKLSYQSCPEINNFNVSLKEVADFSLPAESNKIQVIKAIDGELVTQSFIADANIENGFAVSDIENDILKIAVVNRYSDQKVAIGFIQSFNLKSGAIASCVGHDSHNIIAVGTTDEMICKAVNSIIENKGGISAVNENNISILPLPIAGIMSNADGTLIAKQYAKIDKRVKEEFACTLSAPFMTLSFMALLVIPQLKLSDKGLFDGQSFQFTSVFQQ